jgi:hypothetical protein
MAPDFKDIPDHLRELGDAVPGLQHPVWYSGTVYGATARQLEDATVARDAQGRPVPSDNSPATENGASSTRSHKPEAGEKLAG